MILLLGRKSRTKQFAYVICFQSILFPVTVKKGESSEKCHSEVLQTSALLVH